METLFGNTDEGLTSNDQIENSLNYKLFIALLTNYEDIIKIYNEIKFKNKNFPLNFD